MKNILLILSVAMTAAVASAEGVIQPVNDKIPGELSGRIQSVTMYRDFDGSGNGANSTMGVLLGYTSPEAAGFRAGFAYNYAWKVFDNNKVGMLANDDINVLNEAWVSLSPRPGEKALSVLLGRKVLNGEVFRKDDFRQKARGVEAVMLETMGLTDTRLTAGHAIRMSNWIDAGDRWDYNDFGDVFGAEEDTEGVTWGEAVYTGIENLEVALFNAYAYDVANLSGLRTKLDFNDTTALVGYYRHEESAGDAERAHSDVYGLSFRKKVAGISLEPGYFGVHGSNLRFQETTTGINHPLGASMIISASHFNGGSDTAYLKAVKKFDRVTLYGLYNYTWHDHDKTSFNGDEVNLVLKHFSPMKDLFVYAKIGVGEHDGKRGEKDVGFSDARLFMTYSY